MLEEKKKRPNNKREDEGKTYKIGEREFAIWKEWKAKMSNDRLYTIHDSHWDKTSFWISIGLFIFFSNVFSEEFALSNCGKLPYLNSLFYPRGWYEEKCAYDKVFDFERFEPKSHFKSRLSLIVRVNVVLNRTVVVDSDWRFDNLCGSHLQNQSELYHVSWWYYTLAIDLIGQLRIIPSTDVIQLGKLLGRCNVPALADPDLQIREGPGHPDPEIREIGQSKKNFFSALRATDWSKSEGGWAPRAPSLDLPLTCKDIWM